MAREIATATAEACSGQSLAPIFMADIETAGGNVRMWTGLGSIYYGGNEFLGGGDLVSVSSVEEKHGDQVEAQGLAFSISGVSPDQLSVALGEVRQGLPATLYFAVVDEASGALIGEPVIVYSGLTDIPTIDDTGTEITISLATESKIIDLERARSRRYTPEDQKAVYAGDKGFDYVATLTDAEISWGSGLP